MTRLGITVTVLVSIQLVLTILAQRHRTWRWARVADVLGVLPQWKFFALGAPGHAWHIVVRDIDGHGVVSPWIRADFVSERGVHDAIWNPSKHLRAQFSRHAIALCGRALAGRDATPETSHAYRQLLRHAALRKRTIPASELQFAVLHTIGGGKAHRAFTSRPHRLP